MDNIFFEMSVLFGIAVSVAFVVRLLKQPLIIAYIIAGMIAGPVFLNIVHGSDALFHALAQFGIVLLLFVVGLSLNVTYIKQVGRVVLIGGTIQFVITAGVGFLVMRLLNFSFLASLFVAIAITFSSTIVVLKLLSEKKDLETVYGRYVIGLLLVQDIIAVLLMVFLNTTGQASAAWYVTALLVGGKAVALSVLVFVLAKYLLPKFMDRVAHSGELLFVFTIAWCFGVASLVYWSGFSIEIGAVVAGVSLGASPYQAHIASRLKPLRDFFLVLFFIVLGSELQLSDIHRALAPGLILSAFVLIADPLILYVVMRRLNYTRRNAFLIGITAAQVSEFGFILAFKGRELGYLEGIELGIITIIALLTIFVSSYLIEYNEQLYRRVRPFLELFGKEKRTQHEEPVETYEAWVFGYHRLGWKICEMLEEKKIRFAVIDFNPQAIAKLKRQGIPAFFGDAADVEFLETLPLEKARLIVSTIPAVDDQMNLAKYIRGKSPNPRIVTTLYHTQFVNELYAAGVDYIVLPHLLGGSWISGVLKDRPWTRRTFFGLKKEQEKELRLRIAEEVLE